MKQAILSFDYELFFGNQSGTVQKTLIVPTNKMLDILDEVGAKATFFVDYLMLKFLEKENCQRTIADLKAIEEQLADIICRGHRIELHIHPHWIDAKYKGDGTWDFSDFTHYGLTNFSEDDVERMFQEGVNCLSNIARKVIPDYRIFAFRAGGWVIQPFDKFVNAFKKTGIMLDSSVAIGVRKENTYSSLDFTRVPQKCFYQFEDKLQESDEKGSFWEVPITTFPYNLWNRICNRLYREMHKKQFKIFADGTHYRTSDYSKNYSHVAMCSLAKISPSILLTKIKKSPFSIITFIDHPKDFALINLSNLKKVSHIVSFTTYSAIIQQNTK